jgi:hypothetical protein
MPRSMELIAERTLVKSEPELRELVASHPRLRDRALRVSLSEKGFGTRVSIAARPEVGIGIDDLERLLDELAEPEKRPFSAV